MPAIDRAILRLAITELRTMGTPPKVVLNEAVELAKKFPPKRLLHSSTASSMLQ